MPALHSQRSAGGPALLCVPEVQAFQHWEGLGGAGLQEADPGWRSG